ncbi:hypothetical protein [Williamsia serinedens]|uniref:Uncharacterized protein n=1 Tax=Williamsia serinedens TaxID=391736 RepID=A0ABT1H601_9NOCA|nr:hypothetical protein [Williamsia serinedens]MCP2162658.1 hypothetical protein [Williamsia serinedens]
MSAVPEGYEVVDSITDHYIRLAVPVVGRDEPILICAPRKDWVPPSEVDKVYEFLRPYQEAEAKVLEWHRAKAVRDEQMAEWHRVNDGLPEAERAPEPDELPPFPDDAKATLEKVTMRELDLRWLKPYMSAADYKLLTTSKNIPEKSVEDLRRRLESKDITTGESSASTDS